MHRYRIIVCSFVHNKMQVTLKLSLIKSFQQIVREGYKSEKMRTSLHSKSE